MFFKWDFDENPYPTARESLLMEIRRSQIDAERIAQERRRRRRKQRLQSFFDSHAYVWLVALIAAAAYFAMCIDW